MGRGSAQVRIKLRNIKRGQTVERSFQAGEKWPRAFLDRRPVQFLYSDGDQYNFMDTESYEQIVLTGEQLGDTTSVPARRHDARPDELRRRDHRRRAAGHASTSRCRDRAGLCRRHGDRGHASRPRSRRGWSSRCRYSSRRATRSASTRAPASTRRGSRRRQPGRAGSQPAAWSVRRATDRDCLGAAESGDDLARFGRTKSREARAARSLGGAADSPSCPWGGQDDAPVR